MSVKREENSRERERERSEWMFYVGGKQCMIDNAQQNDLVLLTRNEQESVMRIDVTRYSNSIYTHTYMCEREGMECSFNQ